MSIEHKANLNGDKLVCDYAHCLPRSEFRPRERVTDPVKLRALARRQGWTSRPGVTQKTLTIDLCPKHRDG